MPASLTTRATIIKLLEKCEALSWATLEQMIEIARHSSLITLQSRQLLFSEGDQGSSIFILNTGELEIFKYKSPKNLFSDADIEELILSYSTSAGDIIGEWAITRDQQLRSASVRSTRETQLLEIPYSIIEKVGGLSQLSKFSSTRGEQLKTRDKLAETSSLFRVLTQQKFLRELPQERSYSKGEDIFHEGDESSSVFYILSGSVEVYHQTEKGEQTYSTLKNHQLFGELGVILNTTRSASVRALTDCRLMLLEKNDFLPIAADDYNMSQYLSALRRIYRDRSGEMVLQFHETIHGNPFFISSMRIEGDRELISQIGILNTFLKINIKPQCSNAIVFMYKDKGRAIERTIEMENGHITGLEFHGPTEE
ncbi:MAG: cyclic nucleotide-binding domain-containing protein, partial [Planctomycetia bacterium]|nr:cyclic nucleotide-binding domain-containing protein [Planctomycetia bacterium]